jgi:hypothetical protein
MLCMYSMRPQWNNFLFLPFTLYSLPFSWHPSHLRAMAGSGILRATFPLTEEVAGSKDRAWRWTVVISRRGFPLVYASFPSLRMSKRPGRFWDQ